MTPITNGAAGLIGAIATPRDNYAQKSAQRQEALQLQSILTAQKQQEVAEEQQAASQAENFLQTAKSLSFMGRDRQNLAQHMKGEEKALFETLRDNYGGNFKNFWAAQGPAWMQGAASRLQQAPFFQQATNNRAAVLAAHQAIQKGERVVGTSAADGYRSGEQDLQAFLEGRSDAFNFKGSYKPTDALAHFRQEHAPGRFEWEQVEVSEPDKMASLVNQFGQEVAEDIYHR